MSTFIEPKTEEEALRRREELKGEVLRLQTLLADRDVRKAGTRSAKARPIHPRRIAIACSTFT